MVGFETKTRAIKIRLQHFANAEKESVCSWEGRTAAWTLSENTHLLNMGSGYILPIPKRKE